MRTGKALLQFASSSPMALTLSPLTGIYRHSVHRHHVTFPNRSTNLYNRNFLSPVHLRRSYPASPSNSCRCRAGAPGRQPPPESEPPNGNELSLSEGLTTTFARLQDTVQIFFAVLFWMSLFFWSSVWNGRNNNRPGKGSRFRR